MLQVFHDARVLFMLVKGALLIEAHSQQRRIIEHISNLLKHYTSRPTILACSRSMTAGSGDVKKDILRQHVLLSSL